MAEQFNVLPRLDVGMALGFGGVVFALLAHDK